MKEIKLIIILFIIPGLVIGQSYNIGELTLNLTDSTRNRLVKTELWYPTLDTDSANQRITVLPFILEPTIRDASFINSKYPLIVLSHGTGGNRFGLAWLAIGRMLIRKTFRIDQYKWNSILSKSLSSGIMVNQSGAVVFKAFENINIIHNLTGDKS